MDINFELYKIFYYVASLKSFSKAASRLYISQSAVSQAIRGLEEKLGMQLFVRKTRDIKLTVEGELLFKHVEQAFNYLKTAEDKLNDMKNLDTGSVRIGASDTVCKYLLIPQLRKFHRQYPKIKIQMINRTTSGLLNALAEGLIDIAVVTFPVNRANISAEKLMEVRDVFVASESFSHLKGRKVPLAELARHPLLMLEKNSATRRFTEKFFSSNGINLNPEIELESTDILIELAKIGLGVAHVLRESAEKSLKSGELFEVMTEEELPPRELGIATMKGVPLSKASVEFVSMLKSFS